MIVFGVYDKRIVTCVSDRWHNCIVAYVLYLLVKPHGYKRLSPVQTTFPSRNLPVSRYGYPETRGDIESFIILERLAPAFILKIVEQVG